MKIHNPTESSIHEVIDGNTVDVLAGQTAEVTASVGTVLLVKYPFLQETDALDAIEPTLTPESVKPRRTRKSKLGNKKGK